MTGLILMGQLISSGNTRAADAENNVEPIIEMNPETDGDGEGDADESEEAIQAAPPDNGELPPIEVRGSRPTGPDDTSDATKISGKKLRESPRPSTLEAISQESGDMYVSSRGGGIHGVSSGASGGIMVRGLGGSPNTQVLIVEDGAPDYQGIFGHPIPDAYVPFLIDRVFVIKGGDSVLYGTNALGGVIVFESRRRKEEGFELENDAAYGSYNTVSETGSLLGKWGNWDLASSFHVLRTDGHRDGAGGMNLVGQAGVGWQATSGLRLTLRDKVLHLEGGDPGTASHPFTDHWYDVVRNNASFALEYRHKQFSLQVIPYFHFGVHELYDGFYSQDYTAGGKTEADWGILDSLRLILGLASDWVDGAVENRIDGEKPSVEGMTNYAFYNQLTWRPVKTLSLVAGSRELYNTEYGFIVLYKGGLKWEFYDPLHFRSRVTRNFRQPTIRELYLPYPTANPDLKPEYSLNWDFGFGLDYERVEFSFTGYRTQAENLIKYFGSWPSAEVVNIDHIVIWGVEGQLVLKKLGPVNIYVTGSWQDVGRYTKQNPGAKLNFTVDAGHDFGRHYVGGSVSGEWVHGLYQNNYHRDPMPDPYFMDLTLRYRYAAGESGVSLEPYVFLRNLLDNRYEYIKGYPMPGFNVMGGLKVTL